MILKSEEARKDTVFQKVDICLREIPFRMIEIKKGVREKRCEITNENFCFSRRNQLMNFANTRQSPCQFKTIYKRIALVRFVCYKFCVVQKLLVYQDIST